VPVLAWVFSDDHAADDVYEDRDAGDGANTCTNPLRFGKGGLASRYAVAA
jgi:hypothetical protein